MKTIILFTSLLFVFGLTSCKKDRVCTCEILDVQNNTISTQTTSYYKSRKKDARAMCMSQQTTYKEPDGSVYVDDKYTCKLK